MAPGSYDSPDEQEQIREAAKKSEIPNDVYEAELFRLQTEFVKLQEWVQLSLDPATSAQVVDLADVTVEGVGPVCDRRFTDAAKASSNSRSLSLSSSGAGPTTTSSSPARPIVWHSSGKPSEIA
jgi:hypothetical protein